MAAVVTIGIGLKITSHDIIVLQEELESKASNFFRS